MTAVVIELVQKIFVSLYLDRMYPYLKDFSFFSVAIRLPKPDNTELNMILTKLETEDMTWL